MLRFNKLMRLACFLTIKSQFYFILFRQIILRSPGGLRLEECSPPNPPSVAVEDENALEGNEFTGAVVQEVKRTGRATF